MDTSYVTENKKSRERLRRLVSNISDSELELVIYQEGWTIAAALGHLAFWDERRRVMLKIWKQKGVAPSPYIEDIANDALIPLLLAIPPRKAAELAVLTAEALDKELEELSPEMIAAIEALKERHALNRGIHRKMHLDEIEVLLKSKR
ncbi:MAG: hypothetical protein A2Y90_02355 [Chloroflexi bacterium RBG_13_52_12]|nr:MAG: hypothetical protein A2Y90_02355 [Chloroflexi bacterium RBG_13_52_12]